MRTFLTVLVIGGPLLSLMAIFVTHVDDLPPDRPAWFLEQVGGNTDCENHDLESNDGCIQTVRQIQAVVAAMAAGVLTIAAAAATVHIQAIFVALAGVTALKAAFHQMMYVTNGDLTLPFIIVGAAAVLLVIVGVPTLISALTEKRE